MGEKNYLTAEEARTLCETSLCLKNRIYRCIKDAANENQCKIIWDVYGCSQNAIDAVILDLQKNGYKVCFETFDDDGIEKTNKDSLIIKW